MKLCVFQGTFDPIHLAHLKMADFVLNSFEFENILFIPAYRPPHKDYVNADPAHRLNMVKSALDEFERFDFSDIEFRRDEPSYTYLTITELYKKYEVEGKIGFIIGEDAFLQIETWFDTEKLKESVNFLIFARSDSFKEKNFTKLKAKGYNYTVVDMDFVDISSSKVRSCVKSGKNIENLVPKEVNEYIEKYGLYKL